MGLIQKTSLESPDEVEHDPGPGPALSRVESLVRHSSLLWVGVLRGVGSA